MGNENYNTSFSCYLFGSLFSAYDRSLRKTCSPNSPNGRNEEMTLTQSEYYDCLRRLDWLMDSVIRLGDDFEDPCRIVAANVASHALYMMGRRRCPITGQYYFLDATVWEGMVYLNAPERLPR